MKIIRRDPDCGYVDNYLWVPKKWTNMNAVVSSLSMVFTDSYTGGQKLLTLWEDAPHHLRVPRMTWTTSQLPYTVIDCRPQSFRHVPFKSRIKLDHRPDEKGVLQPTGDNVQQISINALEEAFGGTLQLACGVGKTVIALEHIARCQVPALVVVDNTQLMHQWAEEAEELLEIPGGIGFLKSGSNDWEGRGIVIATYQTLSRRADNLSEDFKRYFGGAYYDEGHHVSAPEFSKAACLIYGRRYSLTATPFRDDGQHIISELHIGPVLYKNLTPMMKPDIYFYWTGLELDVTDPQVINECFDVNGELHLSKIKSYMGRWKNRMWLLMNQALEAVKVGRKILLLSDTVDEVVNLMTMWTRGPHAELFSDTPLPTPEDVGEALPPVPLTAKEAKKEKAWLEKKWAHVAAGKRISMLTHNAINDSMQQWQQYLVFKKIEAKRRAQRREFLKKLISEESQAGLLTYGVKPEERSKMLEERQIIFAITKYGKEGLDCADLDTVLVSHLFSSKNVLQQLKGRPTRIKAGKKRPVIVFFVDKVGLMHGMERKLMKHLRQWPIDEGGPYDFELINYPKKTACKTQTLTQAFGRL